MVRVFICPITTVVDLVAHLPLPDATPIPTLELIRSTRRTLCEDVLSDSAGVSSSTEVTVAYFILKNNSNVQKTVFVTGSTAVFCVGSTEFRSVFFLMLQNMHLKKIVLQTYLLVNSKIDSSRFHTNQFLVLLYSSFYVDLNITLKQGL